MCNQPSTRVERGDLSQLLDRGRERPQEAIDLLWSVIFADRDPDDGERLSLGQPHREQDRRSLVPTRGTGRATPYGVAERIEEEDQALGLYAGHSEVDVVGQSPLAMSVYKHI